MNFRVAASRRGSSLPLWLTLPFVLTLAVTSRAEAFVRSRTIHGTGLHWASGCAFVQPDSAGTPDLPSNMVFEVVQRAIQNWQSATQLCSYLKLKYDEPAPREVRYDGINTVKFRTDQWCPPNTTDPSQCYSEFATGITTTYFADHPGQPDDGELFDADIQLNDINFNFVIIPLSTTPRNPNATIADLENTLTHELGHLQGLDHTCASGTPLPQEVDENGNPPPPCDSLDNLPADEQQVIEDATMFATAMPGEVSKRMPKTDDIAGICAAYPLPNDPGSCDRPRLPGAPAGCSVSARAPAGDLALPLGAVLLLAVARRRSRQQTLR